MEDGNDIGTIMNCTFKGIDLVGVFGEKSIKALVKIFLFLLEQKKHFKEERAIKHLSKAGKISAKTMKEKYGDAVIYKNMKIVEDELRKNEAGNRNSLLDEESLKNIRPTRRAQLANFEKLAKKHGLNYILFPNPDGGYILQVPKEQEAIFEKVYEQHCAWIKKENMNYNREVAQEQKDAKVTAKEVYESMTPESKEVLNNPYPSLTREEVFEVIANLSDEQYNACMKEAFPGYNQENKSVEQIIEEIKSNKAIPDEKKKEIFRALADQDQKRAHEKGLVKDFTVNQKQMSVRVENGKTLIMFPHPQHLNTMITVEVQSLCGRIKWSGERATICMYKDCEISATTTKLVINGDSKRKKQTEYKGRITDLEAKIKSDAQRERKKYQRTKAKTAGKPVMKSGPKLK